MDFREVKCAVLPEDRQTQCEPGGTSPEPSLFPRPWESLPQELTPHNKNQTRDRKMSFSSREASGNNKMDLLLNDCPLLCVIAPWFYLILLSSRYCCHLSPPSRWADEQPCSVRSRHCDREERDPSTLAQTQ